jgi:hypothetical protein
MGTDISLTEKPTQKKKRSKKVRGKNGGARPGAGRKSFIPTEDERIAVKSMAGFGTPMEHIAALIRNGIGIDTLRKHFSIELLCGKAAANIIIGETLFKKALGGDTTAMIWWSKTQMGWSELQKIEHTSPDGTMSPCNGDIVIDAIKRKYANI